MSTLLETRQVVMSRSAHEMGYTRQQGGISYAPALLTPYAETCSMYREVPEGFQAVVEEHGSCIGLWEPGFHWAMPWVQVAYLVPHQHIVFETPVKQCPTQDDMFVEIDVTLVFRIEHDNREQVEKFCYRLGTDRLNDLLKAYQEEAIRGMARNKKHNQIYDLMDTEMDAQLDNTKDVMNKKLDEFGIVIENIIITNVHLPAETQDTLESETTFASKSRFEQAEQKYELLCVNNKEMVNKEKQHFYELLEEVKAVGHREAAEADKALQTVKAETAKIISALNEKERSTINEIRAESALKVSELNALAKIEFAKLDSDGQAQARKLRAETDALNENMRAETRAIVAANEAKAIQFIADAEAKAGKLLESKRRYDEMMRQLLILKGFSLNQGLVLSGNNGDNAVAQMLGAKNAGVVAGLNLN